MRSEGRTYEPVRRQRRGQCTQPGNAVKFLEHLSSTSAQVYFSAGNDEFPAVPGVELSPSVAKLGAFRADVVDLSKVAKTLPEAPRIFNEVAWR